MTTPLNRRSFLSRAALLIAAPFVGKLVATPKPWKDWNDGPAPADMPQPRAYRITGVGVKVPSNRIRSWSMHLNGVPRHGVPDHYVYEGEWDGVSFTSDPGCTNPAYLLADLIERTGYDVEGDWVLATKPGDRAAGGTYVTMTERGRLPHWAMLAHWGQWCDELVNDSWVAMYDVGDTAMDRVTAAAQDGGWRPRFTVNTVFNTAEEMVALRETLRMHCLSWQASDPRYQRSYPVWYESTRLS